MRKLMLPLLVVLGVSFAKVAVAQDTGAAPAKAKKVKKARHVKKAKKHKKKNADQ